MAKLQKYELDAITSTIIDRIKEHHKNDKEQLEYERLKSLKKKVEGDIDKKLEEFKNKLKNELQEKYPELKFERNNWSNGICISHPEKPSFDVYGPEIQNQVVIANINGDIDDIIEKIVDKYK